MVLSKTDLLDKIKLKIGDSTSDEDLSLIEDVSDTLDDYENRASVDWKTKYEELDESWRKRYRDRFFSGETIPEYVKLEQEEDIKEDSEDKTFEDLFEEKESK